MKLCQKRLGSYVTDQYKMFDTGYNPFSFWEKMFGTKEINEVKLELLRL